MCVYLVKFSESTTFLSLSAQSLCVFTIFHRLDLDQNCEIVEHFVCILRVPKLGFVLIFAVFAGHIGVTGWAWSLKDGGSQMR